MEIDNRRPQSQVLRDVPDDSRILDQRDDPHLPLARGALQQIGRADIADSPRLGDSCGSRKHSRPS